METREQGRLTRRTVLRLAAVGVVATTTGGLLAACGGRERATPAPSGTTPASSPAAGSSSGGASKTTIVVGLQAEPVTLDPHQVTDYNTGRAVDPMFERLVRFKDESTELEPGLAEKWDISDDGLTYRFSLRSGVTFHDGTPFDADAVVFSVLRQIDPNHPYHDTGEFAYAEFTFGKVQAVRAIDPRTVEIVLKEPYAPFLANVAIHAASIVSPAAVQKYGRDFSKNPVGTGPFKFVEWKPGVEVILERNPNWWGGQPHVERLIFRPIIEDRARLTEFEAGSIDFIVNIPPDDLPRLKQLPDVTVLEQPGMHVWYLVFNCRKEPFNIKEVRQAVNHAINKEAIVNELLKGTGVLAKGPLPPVVWGYTEDVKQYEYDPQKAKDLLARAGYANGFKVTFWVPESGSGMQQPKAMATAIQADLRAVGIEAEIQTFEWGTYLDKVLGNPDELPELFEMSWIGDNGDPDNFLFVLLSGDAWPPNGFNMGYYKNEQVDELLRQAQRISDRAERERLYQQALKLLVEDAPWAWIDHETQIVAMKKFIQGFKLHPTGVFRFQNVTLGS
ncbi:MAG: ABC transporter substrate-binding protein [Thermomicrobium sp.]|nr:ABC transporter substrate-binding protein [Thermomicrobium sp.]MDW8060213.1 ABC transporter substrate-binding protein [Thermomicrobium sp.]